VSTAAGTAYTTLGMAVTVGFEGSFESVSLLVDSQSLIVGGLLLTPLGLGLGIVTAVGLEWLVAPSFVADPPTAALLGGGIGISMWLVGVVVLFPLWLGVLGNTGQYRLFTGRASWCVGSSAVCSGGCTVLLGVR